MDLEGLGIFIDEASWATTGTAATTARSVATEVRKAGKCIFVSWL